MSMDSREVRPWHVPVEQCRCGTVAPLCARWARAMVSSVLAVLFLSFETPVSSETHRFVPTTGVPTFAVREPVLHIRPGDIVETESLWGGYYEREGGAWPGEVGPFYIEGATPEDTLVVKIRRLRPNRDTAVSTHTPGFISAIAADRYTRMLNDPIPARRYVWRLEQNGTVGVLDLPASRTRIEVPLKPMLGRVAVAPAGEEAFGGLWPGDFGGNMDAADVREGATVYLPVFHDGAYFYFGDGHALQGDGEICGSGLETSMEVTFQFDLIKGQRIRWPRIEDDDHIMVVGSVRPLTDALRIAAVEMVEWLEQDYGFDRWDAYQVLSQLTEIRVANMVDPNYSVVVKFPKRHLPRR
jgi:amidase